MTPKLRFQEHPTGWDVLLTVFAPTPLGERFHVLGRLEQLAKDERWCFLPESGDGLTLSELDQIRHKMANLEQARLLGLEKERSDEQTRLNKLALQEKSNG